MSSYEPPGGARPQSQVPPATPVTPGGQVAPGAPVTPVTPTAPAKRGVRIPPKLIAALVILGIALWFIFANTQDAEIKLWVKTVSVPVWLVLLCTFVAGMITGWLTSVYRRRRAARTPTVAR